MIMGVVARVLASVMLLWALSAHPYGYFTLMRFVVCAVAIYCALQASSQRKEEWTWILAGIAILFNPLIPFHLNRQIWSILDVAVAILLVVSIFFVRGRIAKKPESKE